MAVAAREQRAGHVDRQIQRRSRPELLVVEIAAVRARHDRRDAPPARRRCDAHHAEERMQRQVEAPRHAADQAVRVERDVDQPRRVVEVVRQRARERPDHVVAPVLPQLHVDDADLEHVARFGARDMNRTGQDVPGHVPHAARMDVVQLGRHVEAIGRQRIGTAADRVDRDAVAAVDFEDRLQPGIELTPVAGLDRCGEVMVVHGDVILHGSPVQSSRAACGAATDDGWLVVFGNVRH